MAAEVSSLEARRSIQFANPGLGLPSHEVAEKAIDDVALLEAALREAMGRKNAALSGTPVGSPSKDFSSVRSYRAPIQQEYGALASYSVQLKAWIDMQVDQRLNMVFRGALDSELSLLQQDVVSALNGVSKLEGDINVLKGTQTKLCAVVERISEELSQTTASVSALQQIATKPVDMDSLKDAQARLNVDDLRRETTAAFQSEASAVANLEEQVYRLSQRIDQLANRDSITVIDRRSPSSPATQQVFQRKAGFVDEAKESNVIHIKPPSPYSAVDGFESEREAVYVERVMPSSNGVVHTKVLPQVENEVTNRTSRVRSSVASNAPSVLTMDRALSVGSNHRVSLGGAKERLYSSMEAHPDDAWDENRDIIAAEIVAEEDLQVRRASRKSEGEAHKSGNIEEQFSNDFIEETRRNTANSFHSVGSGRLRLSMS